MKINIVIKDNSIIACSSNVIEVEGITSQEFEVDDDFDSLKMGGYEIKDGKIIFNEDKWNECEENIKIGELRILRNEECFSVINRGDMWYQMNVNTPEREQELKQWYQSWLDVTDTKIIPEKPDWI